MNLPLSPDRVRELTKRFVDPKKQFQPPKVIKRPPAAFVHNTIPFSKVKQVRADRAKKMVFSAIARKHGISKSYAMAICKNETRVSE